MPPKKRRRREDSDPSNYPSPSQPPSSSHRPRRVAAELADALRRASLDLHSPRRPLPSPSSSLSFTPSSDDDVADTHTETWPLPYRGGATPAPQACARIAHTEVTHHMLALTVWSTHNPHNLSCRWLPPTPVATMTTHHLSRHLHCASALCRAVFILFTRRLA